MHVNESLFHQRNLQYYLIGSDHRYRRMLFPVRCWTCGKVIGHLWEPFIEASNKSKLSGDDMSSIEWLFDELNIKRFCCHTIFLSHYQRYEEAIQMGFPEDFSG